MRILGKTTRRFKASFFKDEAFLLLNSGVVPVTVKTCSVFRFFPLMKPEAKSRRTGEIEYSKPKIRKGAIYV